MGKKRFKQLSTEEKMQLASDSGRALEEDISLNKIARQEFRKRKKSGGLQQTLFPEQELGSDMSQPRSETVKEPITIAVGIDGAEKQYSVQKDVSAEATLAEQQRTANDLLAENQSKEDIKKKDMSFLNVFSNSAFTPTENVSKSVQSVADVARINANSPEEIIQSSEKEKEDITKSADLNTEMSKSNSQWTKVVDLSNQNPDDAIIYTNKDDRLGDDILYSDEGDPEVQKKIESFERVASGSTPNVKTYEPAMEKLGLHDYYPDMGQPLAVGNYTGKIIGSNPIFVAGGQVLPMGIYDARKRAIEKGAKEKAARREKIMEMIYAKGAAQYQDQLDAMSMDLLSKFGEATNWDWDDLASYSSKNSVLFWSRIREIKSLGAVTLKTQKQADAVAAKIVGDEKAYVPPSVENLINEWNIGSMNIEKMWSNKKEFNRIVTGIQSYDNAAYYVAQWAKDLGAQKDQLPIDPATGKPMFLKFKSAGDFTSAELTKNISDLFEAQRHNDYDAYYKAMLKFVDDDRIEEVAKGLHKNHKFYGTLEETKRMLMAAIGTEFDISAPTIVKKYNVELLNLQKRRQQLAEKEEMTIFTNANNFVNRQDVRQALFEQSQNLNDDERAHLLTDYGTAMGWKHVKDKDSKPSKKAKFIVTPTPEEQSKPSSIGLGSAFMEDQNGNYVKVQDWYASNKSRNDLPAQYKNMIDLIKEQGISTAVNGNITTKAVVLRTRDIEEKRDARGNVVSSLPKNDRTVTTEDLDKKGAMDNMYAKGQFEYNTYYNAKSTEQGDGGFKEVSVKKPLPKLMVSYELNNAAEQAAANAHERSQQPWYKTAYKQGEKNYQFPTGGDSDVQYLENADE